MTTIGLAKNHFGSNSLPRLMNIQLYTRSSLWLEHVYIGYLYHFYDQILDYVARKCELKFYLALNIVQKWVKVFSEYWLQYSYIHFVRRNRVNLIWKGWASHFDIFYGTGSWYCNFLLRYQPHSAVSLTKTDMQMLSTERIWCKAILVPYPRCGIKAWIFLLITTGSALRLMVHQYVFYML